MATKSSEDIHWAALWDATKLHDTDAVVNILRNVDRDRKLVFLSRRQKCFDTVLHISACEGQLDIMTAFLDDLSQEERLTAMEIKCKCGSTALQRAANNGHTYVVRHILEPFTPTQQESLLSAQNKVGDTALHRAAWNGHTETIKCMMERLIKKLYQLSIQNKSGDTALHEMAATNQRKAIIYTLSILTPMEKAVLLSQRNEDHVTAFQLAASNNHKEALRCILVSLKILPKQIGFLIMNRHPKDSALNNKIINFLHQIRPEELRCAKLIEKYYQKETSSNLSPLLDEVCEVMDRADDNSGLLQFDNAVNDTILHLASRLNHCPLVQNIIECTDEKSLSSTLAKKNKNGETAYTLTTSRLVKNILSWSEDQKGFYYLKVPPKVVVIDSAELQDGMDPEKSCFLQNLPQFSIEPFILRSPTEQVALETLKSAEEEECSGIIVLVLTNSRGSFVKDKILPIREILREMNSKALAGKPKVLLFQAYHSTVLDDLSSPSTSQNALTADSAELSSYELPGEDFIVLSSINSDGSTLRNHMLSLFAENLQHSKADDDMHDVFLKTKLQLVEKQMRCLCEYRTTMNKKLCLRQIFEAAVKCKSLPAQGKNKVLRAFQRVKSM